MKRIKTIELFAGVGGFRVGLNHVTMSDNIVKEKKDFNFVFFNQWEPSNKTQHAYNCYLKRFNEKTKEINNTDIALVDKKLIPDHDLLVGGFPCQDYSVARTLSGNKGIQGKKGVLWWSIYETIKVKKTKFILLENVDRLLISPSFQKGRDFLIILKCLQELNYFVEWKVINAADYGMAQKRKRIFIFACKKDTRYYQSKYAFLEKKFDTDYCDDEIKKMFKNNETFFSSVYNNREIIQSHAVQELSNDIQKISDSSTATFYDSGILINDRIFTFKTKPEYKGNKEVLKNILLDSKYISKDIYINDKNKVQKFRHLKSSKAIKRIKNGYEYLYREGQMAFPENIELPGRTMLTSEGSVNRSTHIIKENDKYRILDPIECERLNYFPDNWTKVEGITPNMRRYLMGNALVCEIIKRLSKNIKQIINMEKN